jgi:hypothetical protein
MYRTAILCVVLNGCEASSLTLREEHRFRVIKNRVLRKIFWPHEGRGKRELEKTT